MAMLEGAGLRGEPRLNQVTGLKPIGEHGSPRIPKGRSGKDRRGRLGGGLPAPPEPPRHDVPDGTCPARDASRPGRV